MKKRLHIDIMLHGRYQCTLHYIYDTQQPISMQSLSAFIEQKLPTLKGKPYTINHVQ